MNAHFGGTWERLEDGRFLEAGSSISNKDAGLPNITGSFEIKGAASGMSNLDATSNSSGSFIKMGEVYHYPFTGTNKTYSGFDGYTFDASKSSDIYGKSTTVQPKSRVVYIYKRIS